jgi:hypothetical protein
MQETKPKKLNHRYLRDKDREPVKGIFRYYEVPGGCMSFSYRAYKEDQTERYDLIDGSIYTIPLGVAKHLNKNGWYPEYGFMPGESGVKNTGFGGGNVMQVKTKVRRFGFQSLEFMDIDELNTPDQQIIEVTSAL